VCTRPRCFVTNGSDGNAFSIDAAVSADSTLKGTASIASVELRDSNADGPVSLLERKDASKPMLSVKFDRPTTTVAPRWQKWLHRSAQAAARVRHHQRDGAVDRPAVTADAVGVRSRPEAHHCCRPSPTSPASAR